MGNRLFTGNLSWGTGDQELRSAFERFGTIEYARVVTDRETGESRGFGFVEFVEAASAQSAINEMNGSVLDGREVAVVEARPRDQQSR